MNSRPPRRALPALAVGASLAVALAAAPWVWRWYQGAHAYGAATPYEPRELLAGGHEPPAPRVAAGLESLDAGALEDAARYAGAHGSRALIVSRHDHIVFERYWGGSSFDTLADAQFFTRLLVALATGVAISHRVIGWPDQPIGAFISEWSHDPRGAITVRDLLQSSSGLAPAPNVRAGADLVAGELGAPLAGTSGVTRRDMALDSQLLALVLERAAKQRFAAYVSRVLWRPLGASDAWLWLDHAGGTAHADCCMMARQGDWIRIGQLLVRDGNYRGEEIIRPGWATFMLTKAAAGREAYATPDVFAVAGEGGNRMWLVPSLQIVILCTGGRAGRDAGWDEARVPNLVIRGARDYLPPAARPGADVSAIVPGH